MHYLSFENVQKSLVFLILPGKMSVKIDVTMCGQAKSFHMLHYSASSMSLNVLAKCAFSKPKTLHGQYWESVSTYVFPLNEHQILRCQSSIVAWYSNGLSIQGSHTVCTPHCNIKGNRLKAHWRDMCSLQYCYDVFVRVKLQMFQVLKTSDIVGKLTHKNKSIQVLVGFILLSDDLIRSLDLEPLISGACDPKFSDSWRGMWLELTAPLKYKCLETDWCAQSE